jgi:GntR family transcriptional regulator
LYRQVLTDPRRTTTMSMNLRPGIPLHEQISSWLREEIGSGQLPPDAQLPSEHELCRQFGVSRVTVRRALQTLDADGLIYRRPGLGSFVCDQRMAQGLVRLTDFAQDLARAGLEASSRVLHHGVEPCPAPVAERLGLAAGVVVVRLDRLRLGNGEAMAMDRTWMPPYYAQLLEGHDLTHDTLYQLLEREHGIQALSGRYRITAAAADGATAAALGVGEGEALLVVERTTRTTGQKPVYFQRRYYRSDRIAYELELSRDPSRAGTGREPPNGMPLREFEPVVLPGREHPS